MASRWLTRVLVLSAVVVPLGLQVSPAQAQRVRVSAVTRSSAVSAARFECAPELQTACSVVGLVLCHFHSCYAVPTSRATSRELQAFVASRHTVVVR